MKGNFPEEESEEETEEELPELYETTVTQIGGVSEGKGTGRVRRRRKEMKLWVRVLLYVILFSALAAAAVAGYRLYRGMREGQQSRSAYEHVRTIASASPSEEPSGGREETGASAEPDFNALAEVNPDIAGWLKLEGTVIDYPIVQGTDNEYYLNHLFTREENSAGCIFMDAENAADFSDRCTFLYGHNMRNGTMFAALEPYRNQSYYESHPVMELTLPDGTRQSVELFAGVLGTGDSGYVKTSFADGEEFLAYVQEMKAQSTFASSVSVGAEDRILGMSTCRYDTEDGRFALFGKLVPPE